MLWFQELWDLEVKKSSNELSRQHEKLVCWYSKRFSRENTDMGDFDLKKKSGGENGNGKIIFMPVESQK